MPAESVDEAFVANLGGLIRRVGADTPARERSQAPTNAVSATLLIADCPERAAEGTVLEGETDDF